MSVSCKAAATPSSLLGPAVANFLIRAWEVADPAGHFGESDIITVATGNPDAIPAGTPGSLGAVSFQLVPEPSVFALGALGAGALLLLRRRR